ncbi:MAG: YlxR family protein [Dehalococcoidales bacterium]|nr:YlxR family protein [Dehalococcoidales bacterium]
MKNNRMPAARHVPQRTCIACRRMASKRELVRLVRTPEGNVEFDVTGRKNGRGAYICPNPVCLEKALKARKALERALRSQLAEGDCARLIAEGRRLIEGLYGTGTG